MHFSSNNIAVRWRVSIAADQTQIFVFRVSVYLLDCEVFFSSHHSYAFPMNGGVIEARHLVSTVGSRLHLSRTDNTCVFHLSRP